MACSATRTDLKSCCRLQLVRRIGTVGSAVAVHWHSRLNQIFVGTGNTACLCLLTIVFCTHTYIMPASAVTCSLINIL